MRGEILTSGKSSLKIHSRSSAQSFNYGVGFKMGQSRKLPWEKLSRPSRYHLEKRGENKPHRAAGKTERTSVQKVLGPVGAQGTCHRCELCH